MILLFILNDRFLFDTYGTFTNALSVEIKARMQDAIKVYVPYHLWKCIVNLNDFYTFPSFSSMLQCPLEVQDEEKNSGVL